MISFKEVVSGVVLQQSCCEVREKKIESLTGAEDLSE